ncbi:MAG: RluA family pseudouridine synthase [Campylobacterales bacterium]
MSEKPLQAGSGEKAYKLLAKQMGISNSEAKALIDRGLVFSHGRKVLIARAMMAKHTVFKVEQPPKAQVIFEDENLLVVNKPPFRDSEEIAKEFGFPLLHRLDRETSGVLMLVKNSDFQKKAIEAFRKEEVAKEYLAIVQGIVAEGGQIDKPIVTTKGHFAKSRVAKEGKCALTIYEPLEVAGGRTKLAVKIVTGRTHQIRVHLAYIRHPIVGDRLYGGPEAKRMMLHAWKVSLMGLEFEAEPTQEFSQFAHS